MKLKSLAVVVAKFVSILACLYFFVCSLSFLSSSFRILGGKNIGGNFKLIFFKEHIL